MALNTHHSLILIRHFVNTYMHKSKNHVIYGRSTYRMTALLSKMSIFWIEAACEMQLVSYGSKRSSQSLFDMLFVCTSRHYLKTTGHIWMFYVSNNCSTIEDSPCVV